MAFENPIRSYRFAVEIEGVDQFSIQKVTLPEFGMSVVEHGGADRNIKTASKKVIGNATFEKLKSLEGSDRWAYDWVSTAVKALPTVYKRNIVVKELANDGLLTVNRWLLEGCFVVNVSHSDLDRMADANHIQTVELSVDDIKLL
jgi:phage tail-like protein